MAKCLVSRVRVCLLWYMDESDETSNHVCIRIATSTRVHLGFC
jgi:hypothetical protein